MPVENLPGWLQPVSYLLPPTWAIEALRDYPGITVISKPEPQDFQPFYPHSPAVGAFGRTPQILEMDLNGEYWGQSLIPVSQVGYLRYRFRYGVNKGIVGAVGRIDTNANAALGTPNEINLFAFSRLLSKPETAERPEKLPCFGPSCGSSPTPEVR